jgi:hypothetical protein
MFLFGGYNRCLWEENPAIQPIVGKHNISIYISIIVKGVTEFCWDDPPSTRITHPQGQSQSGDPRKRLKASSPASAKHQCHLALRGERNGVTREQWPLG